MTSRVLLDLAIAASSFATGWAANTWWARHRAARWYRLQADLLRNALEEEVAQMTGRPFRLTPEQVRAETQKARRPDYARGGHIRHPPT